MSLRAPEPEVILARTISVDECVKFELELAQAIFPDLKLAIHPEHKEVWYLNSKGWPAVTPRYVREMQAAACLIFDYDLSIDRRVHRIAKVFDAQSNDARWSYLDVSNGSGVAFFRDKQTAFGWMVSHLAMKEHLRLKLHGEPNV